MEADGSGAGWVGNIEMSDVIRANGADIYDMCGKGRCVIINQHFSNYSELQTRSGTHKDRGKLYEVFTWLKMDVEVYEDITKGEMEEYLKKEALHEDNEKYKSFVVCILSHGQEGAIYAADGKLMELNEIRNIFNVKSLENKPKLFIVQACRDKNKKKVIQRQKPKDVVNTRIDQVLYQSTFSGSPSLRHSTEGSPFVQILCEVFKERADKDSFYEMALQINSRLAATSEVIVPAMESSLRKKLYFKPETPFNKFTGQPHLMSTIWKVTIASHSTEEDVKELENQIPKFRDLQDKIKLNKKKHVLSIHRSSNQTERMRFNDWNEECNKYIKRYYDNVDFFLFNYGYNDIPDGFKSFIENNKPSFAIKKYNLFKQFDFLKLADELTRPQKESLKRIEHMDHIDFDPKRNAIYFFKICHREKASDIKLDIEDCATFVRMFLLLHGKELEEIITCLVSFVVVPTKEIKEEVSKICNNCKQYLITAEEFQSFDEILSKKIIDTVSSVNKKRDVKYEKLKEFKYDMKGIFGFMAAQDRNLKPSLTENTSVEDPIDNEDDSISKAATAFRHIAVFLLSQIGKLLIDNLIFGGKS